MILQAILFNRNYYTFKKALKYMRDHDFDYVRFIDTRSYICLYIYEHIQFIGFKSKKINKAVTYIYAYKNMAVQSLMT